MKCMQCGHTMTKKRENVPYTALPGTVLVGVEVSRCPNCGEYEVAIPAIEELDRVLANEVIRKPTRLMGHEMKFLRKYLGYSGTDFAKLIGADNSTVSRWETDVQAVGQQTDRLYRTLVALGEKVEEYSIESLAEVANRTVKPHYAFAPLASKKSWKPTELVA